MKRFLSGPVFSAALSLCLFFIVVGSNWATFDKFSSDMPNWDQWDAEGLNLLAPWFEHDHFVAHLFQPHNEHRVVVTKLHNLALTLLNGQWDARLESATNAGLHAALAVAFWLAACRWLRGAEAGGERLEAGGSEHASGDFPSRLASPASRLREAVLFVALAVLFATPVAWQNVLGGFHSQQYWLLLLSFLAMFGLPFARPWSPAWWGWAFVAALGLLTMGSGFFAAAMVCGVVLFRLVRRETTLRAAWPTLVFTIALVVVGLLTRVEVEYHRALRAQNLHDFLFSMLHSLQWPAPRPYPWLAAVLWLPWLLVAWRLLRGQTAARSALTLVAFGGWVLAQIIATAYARGAGGDFPASRYMDTLLFGTATNALALGWLLTGGAMPRGRRTIAGVFSVLWLGVFAWGVYDLGHLALAIEMPDVKRYYTKAEAHMRGYLATNDPAQLEFPDIPYPSAHSLIERLNHESLRRLLPVSIRPPLPMKSAGKDNGPFLENHASELHLAEAPRAGLSPATGGLASLPTWGSFGPTGANATGEWKSAPLTAPLGGWLKFETAGDLGRDDVALELRDVQSHVRVAEVRPTKVPGDTWRAAYVRAPRRPFVVVARDDSDARWFAFSAPVEMGFWSYTAWRCMKNGGLVAETAAVAAVLLGFAALVEGRIRRTPPVA